MGDEPVARQMLVAAGLLLAMGGAMPAWAGDAEDCSRANLAPWSKGSPMGIQKSADNMTPTRIEQAKALAATWKPTTGQ
jgi:hypothetical protein